MHLRLTRSLASILCVELALAGSGLAREEEPEGTDVSHSLAVAARVGGAFHSVFSELGSALEIQLEGGALFMDDRLEIGLVIGYRQPSASHAAEDPRVASGSLTWDLTQQLLTLGLIGRYRFLLLDLEGLPEWSDRLALSGALGPRLHLLKTRVNGSAADSAFGENRQLGTEVAFAVGGGGELELGPGWALVELDLAFGGLDGKITGDASSSALGLWLGYRMMF